MALPLEVAGSFPKFVGKKIPLVVLAARLGPLGHGPGFGGFLYPVSRLGFLLMKKWWGPFHTPGRV